MPAEQSLDSLRIELLGGFRIACGANEIPDDGWRLAKARSLVKIVALAPGQSILREQLVELLWPELDPDAGANNLHQALHVARRTLGALLPDTKPNRILRLQRGVLSLEPPVSLWIDVDAFEAQARELQASDDPAGYYHALDIYRGDLLPDDLYEDWAAERRIALHEQYLSLLDRLAGMHRARREATPAIDALRRIVAIEPDREAAHRGLMELYALTGRRQQALRQYERAREILERELDLEPESETNDLHEAILSGDFPPETWAAEPVSEPQPAPRPEITESISEFLGRAGDFVGRGDELGTLQQALSRVIGGKGEIILVAGEPGIGKTRMSEEFLRYAGSQGVRTLWGRCYEGDGAPAYWPWVQVVRSYLEGRSTAELRTVMGPGAADIARIAPELRERLPDLEEPPPLDPDGERFRLFDSMTTFLKNAAERAPLALIIDDLHSADRSSLLLLEFLAREIAETGLLIIGTYRHVEVERGHPLTRTLGQLARHESNERITLDGLRVADIDRYIELVTGRETPEGLAAAIHEQTEGNPFFVREIVALLIDEERLNNPEDIRSWRLTIPHGIRETIALRTARLSDTAHRVLTTASVSGRDFELPIVAQVASLDELDTLDALEEALVTGLILESPPTPGGFRFTHAITRQTLYDDLSQARRLRMHLRTGEAIEGIDDSDRHIAELARHFAIAARLGVLDKAIDYLVQAGREALRQIAYSEGVAYFEQALDLVEGQSAPDSLVHCRILMDTGDALTREGRADRALGRYLQAVELAKTIDDRKMLAEAILGLVNASYVNGDLHGRYIPILEEALEVIGDDAGLARIRLLEALVGELTRAFTHISGGQKRALELTEEIAGLAEVLDDPEAHLIARAVSQDTTWDSQQPEERLENTAEILRLAEALDSHDRRLLAHSWRIFDFIAAGDMERARHEDTRYQQVAIQIRRPHNIWATTFRQATYAIVEGRFTEAEVLTSQALTIGRRCTPQQAMEVYLAQIAMIRREQNRSEEILDLARDIKERYPSPSIYSFIFDLLLTDTGNLDEPLERLDELSAGGFEEIPRNLVWLPNIALLAVLCAELDHSSAADELYRLLESYADRNVSGGGNVIILGSAARYLGLLAELKGDLAKAETHYRAGIAANRRMGARPFEAHSQYALGKVLMQSGNPSKITEGRHLIHCAAGTARELSMTRLQRTSDQELYSLQPTSRSR